MLFPDPASARKDGLLTAAVRLTPENALAAYEQGIFPWFERMGYGFWFCPPRRGILDFKDLHVPRSLAQKVRSGRWRITVDAAFERVIRGCASARRPEGEGTWISERFIRVYCQLHRQGHAHSVEAWEKDELAGGIYGMHVNGSFSGESMFHARSDAGKAAFLALVAHLKGRGLAWMDTQQATSVVAAFGAREIPREEFLARLAAARESAAQFK